MSLHRCWGPARLAAAIATVIGLLALSTGLSSAEDPPPPKSTFTVGVVQDVDSLNPFIGVTVAAYEMFQLQYPTLTDYGAKDYAIEPEIAESWKESPDHTFWTYKIRPGMKWSDGEPLTAKDAAYTFNRIINGTFEKTNYGNYVGNITAAEAPDDTTLILRVDKPTPIMDRLYVYILPEHVYSKIDETAIQSYNNEPVDGKPTVGGGAYLVAERKVGQFTRLVANPNFFRGKPAVDEIVFKNYANPDALGQALKKGEIDYANDLQPNVYDALANTPNIERKSQVYPGFNELAFNTGAALVDGKPIGDGNPLLKDKRLREAIGWSLDRKVLVDKVLGGHGSAATSIITPTYASLHLTPANEATYDPAKARSLLDAGGYRVGPTASAGQRTAHGWTSGSSAGRTTRSRRSPSNTSSATSPTSVSRRRSRSSRRTPSPKRSARGSTTCSSGDGSTNQTRTTSCPRSRATAGHTRKAAACWPASPIPSTATPSTTSSMRLRAPRPTSPSAPRSSSRCSRSSTTTGRTRSPTTTTPWLPIGRTSSRASSRSQTPTVPTCSSTARGPTRTSSPSRRARHPSSGLSPALIGGIVAAVVVLGGVASYSLLRRRRAGAADDRE